MWLTQFLLRGRRISYKIPGRMWTGKNRKVLPVTKHMLANKERRFAIMKKNEELLSTPYLTVEEEFMSGGGQKKLRDKEFFTRKYLERTLGEDILGLGHKLPDGKTAPTFLDHLNVTRTEHK